MIIHGRIWKDGKWWLAESEIADVYTQGRTRTEAIEMLVDAFESLIDRPDVKIAVTASGAEGDVPVSIEANEPAVFTAFVLQRVRERSGRSLAEVAAVMGKVSKNAYARYEQGEAVPTLEKLEELLTAVDPELTVCIASRADLARTTSDSSVYSRFHYELDPRGNLRQVRSGEVTPFSKGVQAREARPGAAPPREPPARVTSSRKRAPSDRKGARATKQDRRQDS